MRAKRFGVYMLLVQFRRAKRTTESANQTSPFLSRPSFVDVYSLCINFYHFKETVIDNDENRSLAIFLVGVMSSSRNHLQLLSTKICPGQSPLNSVGLIRMRLSVHEQTCSELSYERQHCMVVNYLNMVLCRKNRFILFLRVLFLWWYRRLPFKWLRWRQLTFRFK